MLKPKMMILTMALAGFTALGPIALAKEKLHHITFEQNVMVKGTMVKKGVYGVKFDDQTNSFTLLDGNHSVVTTTAKEEALPKKAPATSFDIKMTDGNPVLSKVTFEGDHYALVLDDGGNTN
jgi:hypothetical protein